MTATDSDHSRCARRPSGPGAARRLTSAGAHRLAAMDKGVLAAQQLRDAVSSGWLRAGYSRSDPAGGWRNYLIHDISALQVLDAPFAGARPGYAHDPRMREVFCELSTSVDDQ